MLSLLCRSGSPAELSAAGDSPPQPIFQHQPKAGALSRLRALCHCEPSRTTVRQSASPRSGLSISAHPGESAPIFQPAPTVGADALGGPRRPHQTPRRSPANPHVSANVSLRTVAHDGAAIHIPAFRSFNICAPRRIRTDLPTRTNRRGRRPRRPVQTAPNTAPISGDFAAGHHLP